MVHGILTNTPPKTELFAAHPEIMDKKADYASLPPITGDYNVGPDYGRKAKRSPSGVFLSGSGNLDEPESRDYVVL